jgi:hypothetical protein
VASRRLTAWAMAQPSCILAPCEGQRYLSETISKQWSEM